MRRFLIPLLLGLLLVSGCTTENPAANRIPGDKITYTEAQTLAGLLQRNVEQGGADVKITAPYAEGALLTMTGVIDFTTRTGTLDAVTTYQDQRPDETRTLYFTPDKLVTGNIPGLTDAMAAIGKPEVQYLRSDLDQAGKLVDNIVGMLIRLAADSPDDPNSLIAHGYTWEGSRTIDGVLTSIYQTGASGATVSVGAQDKLLHQFEVKPINSDFTVTIILSNHGPRTVTFPPDEQIVDASDYPQVVSQLSY